MHGLLYAGAVNNTATTKARPTAKHSRKGGTRSGGVLQAKHKMKIDWAFRRLRNQTVRFFAKGNPEVRAELAARLEAARNYSDVEKMITRREGRRGTTAWHQFMDTFFSHRINRRAR